MFDVVHCQEDGKEIYVGLMFVYGVENVCASHSFNIFWIDYYPYHSLSISIVYNVIKMVYHNKVLRNYSSYNGHQISDLIMRPHWTINH